MVEVSKLRSLDIYTNTGHYVGRVQDIVLNIRLGTISKLQVQAVQQERKPVGLFDNLRDAIQGGSTEDRDVRAYQNEVLTVDFDKVQAIGDIMLINPRDIKKISPEPQIPEAPASKPETQPPADSQVQFDAERL